MIDPALPTDPSRWPAPDDQAASAVERRASEVLRPTGALARLDEMAVWLGRWQRTTTPAVERPTAIVFVGDHGLVTHGVSAYPAEVTSAMLAALREGAATAAALAEAARATLEVVDVGVGRPTNDISVEPALDPEGFARCWEAGVSAVASSNTDLLVVGEMGIGNTTAAAAVAATLFGGPVDAWVGRGTGIDDEALDRKCEVVDAARRRTDSTADPLEVLRSVGGAELVAMAAAVAEARRRSLPVLLDGYVVGAAVAPLLVQFPGALDHCLAAHCSAEPGHGRLLERLGLDPLLSLELRLGEASGALLAVPIVRMAAAAVTRVATFAEWGIER